MTTTTTEIEAATSTGTRILPTAPLYWEIVTFFTDEADALDEDLHNEWFAMLTDDIWYEMPSRRTVYRRDGDGYEDSGGYYGDDKTQLEIRVRHNTNIESAWFREPPTRTHRIVTNIIANTTDVEGEYAVKSSVLMMANRFDQDVVDIIAGKRHDILRRTPDGLKLAKRRILIDQALLTQQFANLFL